MIVSDVINKVFATVNSSCADESEIIDMINEMVSDITRSRDIPLPGLETSRIVSCDGYRVALPFDFSQNMFAASVTGRKVWVCPSMRSLLRRFPSEESVAANNDLYICVSGKSVEVRPFYSGEIKLFYYKSPDEVSSKNEALPLGTEVPLHLQKKLAHSYCCKELYSDIEDGIEGGTPNTIKFENRYESAVDQLRRILKHGQSRPEPLRDNYTFQRI